jgi:hypothetical protein
MQKLFTIREVGRSPLFKGQIALKMLKTKKLCQKRLEKV